MSSFSLCFYLVLGRLPYRFDKADKTVQVLIRNVDSQTADFGFLQGIHLKNLIA